MKDNTKTQEHTGNSKKSIGRSSGNISRAESKNNPSKESPAALTIGCHESSSKGYLAMGKMAVRLGGSTFQYFTRNPRGGNVKPLDTEDIRRYAQYAADHNLALPLAHAPYTLNACSAKEDLRRFAIQTMKDDISRLEYLPGSCYNFHPGSHTGQGAEEGIRLIAQALNEVIRPEKKTTVLLETMAGKGSEVGRTFGELRAIIDRVELPEHVGVCLDTCHVWDGGYDIVNHLDDVLEEFDRVLGLDRLKAIHLNDSKNPLGSHRDRHEKIGRGCIGLEALVRVITHPALKNLPFYLETPNEDEGYKEEMALLRKCADPETGREAVEEFEEKLAEEEKEKEKEEREGEKKEGEREDRGPEDSR